MLPNILRAFGLESLKSLQIVIELYIIGDMQFLIIPPGLNQYGYDSL